MMASITRIIVIKMHFFFRALDYNQYLTKCYTKNKTYVTSCVNLKLTLPKPDDQN